MGFEEIKPQCCLGIEFIDILPTCFAYQKLSIYFWDWILRSRVFKKERKKNTYYLPGPDEREKDTSQYFRGMESRVNEDSHFRASFRPSSSKP